MNPRSLRWSKLILFSTVFDAPDDSAESVEWVDDAATLFIQMANRDEIQLKMDNKVFDIQVRIINIMYML
jgi:hypothetical protein